MMRFSYSGHGSTAHYAEAQGAESVADFVHKLRLALKELRETKVWIRVVRRAELVTPSSKLDGVLQEVDELISIFVTSIKTASRKKR